jgi:hypothetical protein
VSPHRNFRLHPAAVPSASGLRIFPLMAAHFFNGTATKASHTLIQHVREKRNDGAGFFRRITQACQTPVFLTQWASSTQAVCKRHIVVHLHGT